MSHVYISYAREDSNFADLIEDDLAEVGHSVWRDTSSIRMGSDWGEAIEEALNNAYAVVVVLTQRSLTNQWVKREMEFALNKNTSLISLQLEQCEIPNELVDVPVINFSKVHGTQALEQVREYRRAFKSLLNILYETRPLLKYLQDLQDADDEVREKAAKQLGDLGDPIAAKDLIQALGDPDVDVRFAAAEALGKLKRDIALKSLIRLLDDDDPDVCAASAIAIGHIGSHDGVNPLIEKLTDPDRFVRAGAAQALGNLRSKEAVRPLVHMMRNDSISDVRQAATLALCSIRGTAAESALRRAGIDWESFPEQQ